MDTSKRTAKNEKKEVVSADTNKRRYWIVAGVTAALLGIAGFTIIVLGFMYAVTLSNESNVQTMALLGIATAILIVYLFSYFCNKVIFNFFLRFSPLPKKYIKIAMLIPWGVIGAMYFVMSMVGMR